MLNDTSVASVGSYIRTCRRIRNSKKIATIRDFHQNICVNPTIILDRFYSLNVRWQQLYWKTDQFVSCTVHDDCLEHFKYSWDLLLDKMLNMQTILHPKGFLVLYHISLRNLNDVFNSQASTKMIFVSIWYANVLKLFEMILNPWITIKDRLKISKSIWRHTVAVVVVVGVIAVIHTFMISKSATHQHLFCLFINCLYIKLLARVNIFWIS